MSKLGRKSKSADDIRKAQLSYFGSIMEYLQSEQMQEVEEVEGEHRIRSINGLVIRKFLSDLVGEDHLLLVIDPNVPTRLQIKMNSAKIVEKSLNTEDDV